MIATFRDLKNLIPRHWNDAEIGIAEEGSFKDEIHSIYRLSLHEDDKGRKVILIHQSRINKALPKIKEDKSNE